VKSHWIAFISSLLFGLALWQAADAHHSYAMFDKSKEVNSAAVVRVWEYTSPHATLWVYINDEQGTPQLWGLEAPGPAQLVRSGWDKETVQPGDKVTVTLNPLRDGRNGGSLVKLVLANGRVLGTGGPAAAPATAKE
jgi:hypothetical protein